MAAEIGEKVEAVGVDGEGGEGGMGVGVAMVFIVG